MSDRTYIERRNAWDFFAYGRAGLELARADERRARELQRGGTLPSTLLWATVRQRLGANLISLGQRLAGSSASAASAVR